MKISRGVSRGMTPITPLQNNKIRFKNKILPAATDVFLTTVNVNHPSHQGVSFAPELHIKAEAVVNEKSEFSVHAEKSQMDFSFLELGDINLVGQEQPRRSGGKRSQIHTLKLQNNAFPTIDGLLVVLENLRLQADRLKWLDLSFNSLTKIEPVLLGLTNLSTLYLHKNDITNIKDVLILSQLPLRSVTLQGNPIESNPAYRRFCVSALPVIQSFDYARITAVNRENARVWRDQHIWVGGEEAVAERDRNRDLSPPPKKYPLRTEPLVKVARAPPIPKEMLGKLKKATSKEGPKKEKKDPKKTAGWVNGKPS